jgi:hypothetical protein
MVRRGEEEKKRGREEERKKGRGPFYTHFRC